MTNNTPHQAVCLYTEDINRITIVNGVDMRTIEIERDHFNDLINKFSANYESCKQPNGPKLKLIRVAPHNSRTFLYRGKSLGIRDRDIWQCIEDPKLTLCIHR